MISIDFPSNNKSLTEVYGDLYNLAGTEYSALYLISSLVLTLFLMPRELEVVFLWSLATQMITLVLTKHIHTATNIQNRQVSNHL